MGSLLLFVGQQVVGAGRAEGTPGGRDLLREAHGEADHRPERSVTHRTEKLYQRLAADEDEFRRELIPQLRACAAGVDTEVIVVSSLLPSDWPPNMSSPDADRLLEMAADILSRRSHLGLDATCLAATYRQACIRQVDLEDHHRPGPRQQAQQLLQSLGEAS